MDTCYYPMYRDTPLLVTSSNASTFYPFQTEPKRSASEREATDSTDD